MLYRVLVVGVQHPSGQLVHVAPNSIPVFLYGSRVIPAVPPSLQHLLAFLALLLLNHFSGLLQHALEHRLVLHGEHRFAGPLDLLVQNLHAVVRCLGGLPVNLGSELLLLVKTALFCSLFLELLQPAQTLVEYLQCVSLTVGQLVHAQLTGRILEHFPVRQGVGALLILNSISGGNFPRCLWQIVNRLCGNYQFALADYTVEILSDLSHIICGLSIVLPAGRGFPACSASVALVDHEICCTVILYCFCRFKDYIRPCCRFSNNIQDIRACGGVRPVPASQEVESGQVYVLRPVVRVKKIVLNSLFRKKLSSKVKFPPAYIYIRFFKMYVLVLEQCRYLFDRGFG